MSWYPLTQCSVCQTRATNQPVGNVCHRCLVGIMEAIPA